MLMRRLNPLMMFCALLAIVFVAMRAFAQVPDIPVPPTSAGDVFAALAALVGGSKGAGFLAIAGLAVQALSAFVLSPLWDSLGIPSKFKFLAFALLSLAATVIPQLVSGVSFLAAVSSSAFLLLLMQYGHRIYELFFEKPAPPAA